MLALSADGEGAMHARGAVAWNAAEVGVAAGLQSQSQRLRAADERRRLPQHLAPLRNSHVVFDRRASLLTRATARARYAASSVRLM